MFLEEYYTFYILLGRLVSPFNLSNAFVFHLAGLIFSFLLAGVVWWFVKLFLKKENIVRMGIAPMRIEVFTTISGVDFEDCFQQRIVDEVDGIEVSIIGLKQLKINKKASGRHKDLDDFENLP